MIHKYRKIATSAQIKMTMLVKLHHAFHARKRQEKNDLLQFNKLEKLTPLCTQTLVLLTVLVNAYTRRLRARKRFIAQPLQQAQSITMTQKILHSARDLGLEALKIRKLGTPDRRTNT